MTLGNKLSKLRKEQGYTQEQLADIIGVSRQAISKWESDCAYPETERLIRLGELYGCSIDYLLKDDAQQLTSDSQRTYNIKIGCNLSGFHYEKRSKKVIHGLPLWHINIGFGRTAHGIIAVGLKARGVVSFGMISAGVVSFGLLSAGLLAMGIAALGLAAAGALAAGIISAGAISLGVVAFGAIAVGEFAAGALAVGRYAAVGDFARAAIAIGKTDAAGSLYQALKPVSGHDRSAIAKILTETVPFYLTWAGNMFLGLI